MHKFILTLLLFVGFAQVASAQREFANLELPLRQPEDLVTVADDNGNVCLYFFQNNKLHFTLLSPTGAVKAQHEIPYRWNRDPQVLGTRVTDTDFIFYSRYENGRRDYVRPFAINRKTGAFRSLQDVELEKERNTYFVGGFGDDEHFYMLYTDRKDRLHLYRSNDTSEGLAKMDLQIFEPNLPETRTRDSRLADLIYVHPNMERTVMAGYHRSKIYSRDGNILIIYDGQPLKGAKKEATTEILALNWETGETSYRTLPAIKERNEPVFNSFLFRDTLYRLQLEDDKLSLTAYNFDDLKPVKTFTFEGEEEIAIKSTPVYQRGVRGLFKSDVDTVKQTNKVLRKLSDGLPAITVDAFTDSTIQLTIGSYDPPAMRNSSSDMTRMVRTPDRYYRTSRGLMMIPGRWVPAYNIPSYYLNSPYYSRYFYDPYGQGGYSTPSGPGVSTYFRAVLDNNTLAKAETGNNELVQDKLDKFEQELKSEPDYKTVYRYGNKLHYGYYDRKSKTFRIMEFAAK